MASIYGISTNSPNKSMHKVLEYPSSSAAETETRGHQDEVIGVRGLDSNLQIQDEVTAKTSKNTT